MNLQESLALLELKQPRPVPVKITTKSRLQIARKVFARASEGGTVYKYHSPRSWADKHLPSKEFILMEIDINAAASSHEPKNPDRVLFNFKCAAESMEPIVVDKNNRKEGSTLLGYVPKIIVKDGKHRKQAQIMQGRTRIMAWVGIKAAKYLLGKKAIQASDDGKQKFIYLPAVDRTKAAAVYEIYATTVPSVGLANTVMRQDSGEAGSRPRDHMHSGKKKVKSAGGAAGGTSNSGGSGSNPLRMGIMSTGGPGARSSGSLNETSESDSSDKAPDASDQKTFEDASDRRKWNAKRPQNNAPGTGKDYTKQFGTPNLDSPGSGVGPRIVSKGASKSDFSRQLIAGCKKGCMCADCSSKMKADGIRINKIATDFKEAVKAGYKGNFKASAPPGKESMVKALKKKYGEDSVTPFKIAWWQYNQGGN